MPWKPSPVVTSVPPTATFNAVAWEKALKTRNWALPPPPPPPLLQPVRTNAAAQKTASKARGRDMDFLRCRRAAPRYRMTEDVAHYKAWCGTRETAAMTGYDYAATCDRRRHPRIFRCRLVRKMFDAFSGTRHRASMSWSG